jgi:3-methylfumaryl-CoA hydratase
MAIQMNQLREWIGRTELQSDQITPVPIAALAATLDRNDPFPRAGDVLPPLWHWLYFLPLHRQSEIGADGHARRGAFLPPVPLPRRMWAGSRLQFYRPLRVGENVTRVSRIVDVSQKDGRSGSLVFVQVRHEISDSQGVALTDEHDIVYRDLPAPGEGQIMPKQAPADHAWTQEVRGDEALLFRYSALTFNGHRIHYDRRYVTEAEGYPGLVVHGPLIATLLLELLRTYLPQALIERFSFRALKPLFDTAPFAVCGRVENDREQVSLWAKDADGGLAMEATAIIRA